MPEALAGRARLPHVGERLRHGAPRERAPPRREPERAGEEPRAVPAREQPIAEQRQRCLEGAGHRGGSDLPEAQLRVRERHAEPGLHAELRRRADLAEEVERLGVRTHERVRSVVHHLACHRVGEGVGAPAEERPALEERGVRAGAREPHRRRQTREAAAHHDDVAGRHPASQ